MRIARRLRSSCGPTSTSNPLRYTRRQSGAASVLESWISLGVRRVPSESNLDFDMVKLLSLITGPSRPPCPRGQSFTSKSLYLRHQLIQSAEEMQLVITPPTLPGSSSALRQNRIDMAEFNLHTDKRAVERKEAGNIYHHVQRRQSEDSSDNNHPTPPVLKKKEIERKERRSSSISSAAAARAVAGSEAEERPSAQPPRAALMRRSSSFGSFPTKQERSPSLSPLKLLAVTKNVAEWRKRCHAARRRVSVTPPPPPSLPPHQP